MKQSMKRTLRSVTPTWNEGDGVFTYLADHAVPWQDMTMQLNLAYYGNYSGSKLTSPLVDGMLNANGVLDNAALSRLASTLWKMYGTYWKKEWDTLELQYNPIENYSMTETSDNENKFSHGQTIQRVTSGSDSHTIQDMRTDNLTHKSTPNTTLTNTDAVIPFNSTAVFTDKERNTQTASGDVTDTDSGTVTMNGTRGIVTSSENTDTYGGTDTTTESHTLKRSGNIGVTTSQQMLQSERELWQWNFFENVVFPDIDKCLCCPIFVLDSEGVGA